MKQRWELPKCLYWQTIQGRSAEDSFSAFENFIATVVYGVDIDQDAVIDNRQTIL